MIKTWFLASVSSPLSKADILGKITFWLGCAVGDTWMHEYVVNECMVNSFKKVMVCIIPLCKMLRYTVMIPLK